ncbi:MAG: methyltransferase domain-containing protein [Rickettsiales bacterium]|jgi:malonyl-CoA O-methyltransferase|nr:methyltransferase domain-containing protein [Rickettsiales bacterium]
MTPLKTLIKRDFNNKAHYYHTHSSLQKEIAKDLYCLSKDYLTLDSKIIDLGSGDGAIISHIPNKFHKNVTLLDNAQAMLDIAKTEFPSCNIMPGDFNDLSLHKQKYDIIFANMSLHWSLDIKSSLKQIRQILKPNGKIFVSLPSTASFKEITKINQHLTTKLKTNPLIDSEDFLDIIIQTKSYIQDFDSLFDLLHHFKLSGIGYKANNSKPITKADYRYLKQMNDEIKQLSWEIIFIKM